MLGLGIGIASNHASSEAAAAIEDYMWSLASAGNLQPLASGTVSDFHDTWDLDGPDYMPQETPTSEGYGDVDSKSDVQPLDV